MEQLLGLLRGVETSIRSRLGQWMQEVSLMGDQAAVDIAALQVQNVIPDGTLKGQALTWNEAASKWAGSAFAAGDTSTYEWRVE